MIEPWEGASGASIALDTLKPESNYNSFPRRESVGEDRTQIHFKDTGCIGFNPLSWLHSSGSGLLLTSASRPGYSFAYLSAAVPGRTPAARARAARGAEESTLLGAGLWAATPATQAHSPAGRSV